MPNVNLYLYTLSWENPRVMVLPDLFLSYLIVLQELQLGAGDERWWVL